MTKITTLNLTCIAFSTHLWIQVYQTLNKMNLNVSKHSELCKYKKFINLATPQSYKFYLDGLKSEVAKHSSSGSSFWSFTLPSGICFNYLGAFTKFHIVCLNVTSKHHSRSWFSNWTLAGHTPSRICPPNFVKIEISIEKFSFPNLVNFKSCFLSKLRGVNDS